MTRRLRSAPLPWLLGCILMTPISCGRDPQLASRLDEAVRRAAACFDRRETLPPEQIWLLLEAQEFVEPGALGERPGDLAARATGPMAPLVRPDYPRGPLKPGFLRRVARMPEPLGEFTLALYASTECRDGGRPSAALAEFIDEPELGGYALTHQILVIEWARRVGCDLPPEWQDRERALGRRVLAELESQPAEFGDLFVELLAALMLADATGDVRRDWVTTVADAQAEDGCWHAPDRQVEIRIGDKQVALQGRDPKKTHASSMAVFVLARYADRVR